MGYNLIELTVYNRIFTDILQSLASSGLYLAKSAQLYHSISLSHSYQPALLPYYWLCLMQFWLLDSCTIIWDDYRDMDKTDLELQMLKEEGVSEEAINAEMIYYPEDDQE